MPDPEKAPFSIRTKLTLILVAIVAGISLSTLYITEQKIGRHYNEFLASEFQKQADFFAKSRNERFEDSVETLADAISNVRILAALQAGEKKRAYTDLSFQISEYIQRRNLHTDDYFFRFILPQGKMLTYTNNEIGKIDELEEESLEKIIQPLVENYDEEQWYNAGYMWLEANSKQQLYEIMIVPVVDEHDETLLAYLVAGSPFETSSELLTKSNTDYKYGLYIENNLFAPQIGDTDRASVLHLLKQNRRLTAPELTLQSIRYKLFTTQLSRTKNFAPVELISLVSLSDLRKLISEIKQNLLLVALLSLGIALTVGILLAHRLTQPILQLVQGTEQIQSGNLSIKLPIKSKDELGRLTTSFNNMADGLALKDKYRDILEKTSDKDVVEEILRGELKLGGETRYVSVLFCDIRGFTSLTEGMPPAEVITMLNEHMTILTRVVNNYNGVVDKFVGDEIMVLFGAPRSYGDDVRNASQCALEMIHARNEINKTSKYKINIGIGIASGEVVAGYMGSNDRLNYTVLGEQVNLAARLCGAAKPGEVLIEQNIKDRLGESAKTAEHEPMHLKGFSAPIQVYALNTIDETMANTSVS